MCPRCHSRVTVLPFLLFCSFASFRRLSSYCCYWHALICLGSEIIFQFFIHSSLSSSHFSPSYTHTYCSFFPPCPPFIHFLPCSCHHLFPSVVVPPPLSVRQILFKKLSCSLMVKTLANRYLHTWQNASGQGTGRERQWWREREREQVREKGKKITSWQQGDPYFHKLKWMDRSGWVCVSLVLHLALFALFFSLFRVQVMRKSHHFKWHVQHARTEDLHAMSELYQKT